MDKRKITAKNIISALVGVLLVGVGVAFNNCAGLGNDPVGIVYDGIRSISGMTAEQLGTASNLVNIGLMVVLFFVGRRYISLGTFLYFIPYGFFVDFGKFLYSHLAFSEGMASRIGFSVAGCLLLYLGVAIYIAVDMGVDPFTGVVLVLRDVLKKEYRYVKIGFDITMIVVGTLLGGRLGVVTIVTAVTAGPVIQYFTGLVKKYWLKEN
ncbi:MAG: DUF6198 family protein [Eubacteriales bacterium]|nr:DUF6198 family protein [Eubacteriales bacterium]